MKVKINLINHDNCFSGQRVVHVRIGGCHSSGKIYRQSKHSLIAIAELIYLKFFPILRNYKSKGVDGNMRI